MDVSDMLAAVRALLHGYEPSAALFQRVIRGLGRPEIVPDPVCVYLVEHVASWPEEVRREAPWSWILHSMRTAYAPRYPLFNALELPYAHRIDAVLSSRFLGELRWLVAREIALDLEDLHVLVNHEALSSVHTLDLGGNGLKSDACMVIARSSSLHGLRSLSLEGIQFLGEFRYDLRSDLHDDHIDPNLRAFAHAECLSSLQSLDVRGWTLTLDEMNVLKALPRLEEVRIRPGSFTAFTDAYEFPSWKRVHLHPPVECDDLSASGWKVFKDAEFWELQGDFDAMEDAFVFPKVRSLRMEHVYISSRFRSGFKRWMSAMLARDVGLRDFATCAKYLTQEELVGLRCVPWLSGLRAFALHGGVYSSAYSSQGPHSCERDILMLLKSQNLSCLEFFQHMHIEYGDRVLHTIAESAHLSSLRVLDLSYGGCTDRGVMSLAFSEVVGGLRVLTLRGCKIGFMGLCALLGSPYLQELECLDVSENSMGGDVVSLGRWEGRGLERLREVVLSSCDLGAEQVRVLLEESFLDCVWSLDMSHNRLGGEGVERVEEWSRGGFGREALVYGNGQAELGE